MGNSEPAALLVLLLRVMATAPNRLDNLRSLRLANADAALATAFATLVTGAFLVGFVKLLGGSDLWIGLLSSVPSLLGILQIMGAIWGRGFTSYKRFIFPGATVWRFLYIPVALLPIVPLPDSLRLTLLIICVAVAAAANFIVSPIYNDWLAEMVPVNSRGSFFSRRNAISTAVGAVVGIVGGLMLDAFRKAGNEMHGLSVIYALGVVCAAASLFFFTRMSDMQREVPVRQSLREGLRAIGHPFLDREFRRVLIFLAVFFFGQTFVGNLYSAYALESLNLSFTVIQGTAVAQAFGMVVSAQMWGFLADRYGNKPMLMLCGLGIATNPIAWMLTNPANPTGSAIMLLCAHVLMGIFWSGVALCQFNLLLATAKPEDRANYLGAGLALQSVISGIAPLAGATVMSLLRTGVAPVMAYKLVFLGGLIFRALSVLFLAPVKEEGSSKFRTTIRDLRKVTPRGFRAMRSLTRSSDVETRSAALENVASEGMNLAADEIIKTLSDPSPKLRRNAASALSRLGDASAQSALLAQLEEHPDLVEEETIMALGAIGTERAVPSLLKFLASPRSLLRRAAVRALGRIGSPDATEALMKAASEVDDPDLRRSSIQALRALEAREAAQVISDALFDPHPSVRIAAAEAVAEMELREALPYLRQSLAYYQDEAVSEVAYALGAVGSEGDVTLILETAQTVRSRTARRRCLLGAARLLGVEREAYRLMLLEGMELDRALMSILPIKSRLGKQLLQCVTLYASGEEERALSELAEKTRVPEIGLLAKYAVAESFLVAASVAGKRQLK